MILSRYNSIIYSTLRHIKYNNNMVRFRRILGHLHLNIFWIKLLNLHCKVPLSLAYQLRLNNFYRKKYFKF